MMQTAVVSSARTVVSAPPSPRTIIVVPCYNEESRLSVPTFRDFAARHPQISFCLVNDGSQDQTLVLLYQLMAGNPDQFHVVNLPRNQGKAEAVRQGMCAALKLQPDYVGYWDADLAAPLESILQFQAVLDRHCETDWVVGIRLPLLGHDVGRCLFRRSMSRLFACSAATILGLGIHDTQCGHKLFRASERLRRVFETPFRTRWIFDVELFTRWIGRPTETNLAAARHSIYELPLDSWHDVPGSKLRPRDMFLAIFELCGIAWSYRQ